MKKIGSKLWICDVVTPQSCPRKWGKWTERICEETSFLFRFFLKLGRRAHHDRFFPTFGIILAQTSLSRQLFKVSNIRNGIHCSLQLLFEQKVCKSESDRVAGKPGTPCDCAGCVKERGLMRSSPLVRQSSLSFLQKEERVWPPSQNSAQYERVVEL